MSPENNDITVDRSNDQSEFVRVPANEREFMGHPVGLFVLFFTEMWERFSYYGMRALLVLYLVQEINSENPGLGWSDSDAGSLYGWYTMLVYITPILGGIIADKYEKKTPWIKALIPIIGSALSVPLIAIATMQGNFLVSRKP